MSILQTRFNRSVQLSGARGRSVSTAGFDSAPAVCLRFFFAFHAWERQQESSVRHELRHADGQAMPGRLAETESVT